MNPPIQQEMTSDPADLNTGKPVPVVCIGMSAGGLHPLKTILKQLSSQTGMAFFVIHHVVRDNSGRLSWLVSHWSEMPVEVARSGTIIRPNHIYLIPPAEEVLIEDGRLRVQPRSKQHGFSNVVTLFLDSVVTSHTFRSVAVILSGLDEDGAAALSAFHRAGGITIAQRPSSAKFRDMPESAIDTGSVDYVLEPEAIGRQLNSIGATWLLRERIFGL